MTKWKRGITLGPPEGTPAPWPIVYGGILYGIATRPEDMRPVDVAKLQAMRHYNADAARANALNAFRDPQLEAIRLRDIVNAWRHDPRPPGIYWTRTGGNSHRVEIVRG